MKLGVMISALPTSFFISSVISGLMELYSFAVVAHDRVHHGQGLFSAEMVEESGHDFDLAHRPQKTGVDTVEGESQAFPVIDEFLHGIGQVHKAVMIEAAGVVG